MSFSQRVDVTIDPSPLAHLEGLKEREITHAMKSALPRMSFVSPPKLLSSPAPSAPVSTREARGSQRQIHPPGSPSVEVAWKHLRQKAHPVTAVTRGVSGPVFSAFPFSRRNVRSGVCVPGLHRPVSQSARDAAARAPQRAQAAFTVAVSRARSASGHEGQSFAVTAADDALSLCFFKECEEPCRIS